MIAAAEAAGARRRAAGGVAATVPRLHRIQRALEHQADGLRWISEQMSAGRIGDPAAALEEILGTRIEGIAADEVHGDALERAAGLS